MVDGCQEMPFTGEFDQAFSRGVYVCRRCGAHLFKSEHKFDAHCGWPAFDKEIRGAVRKELDPDGVRTAISCKRCGAHLGHMFIGERFTKTNTRHCVNSLAMRLIPNGKRTSAPVRRDKHTEVIQNGVIIDADNQEAKY